MSEINSFSDYTNKYVKKGIDDKEAAYSDHEIRRKQEKIMDVFYQFGELMNLDPCDEKV